MELLKADLSDFERIKSFYKNLCENTVGIEKYARWIYGVYPTDEIIKNYIESGEMFYSEENGLIISALALTCQNADYHNVAWSRQFNDEEVTVIHLLGVSPEHQKSGLARFAVRAIIEKSKKAEKKSVRLDALMSNKPAQRLYEKSGFIKRDKKRWYAENTGTTEFLLYELIL